MASCLFTALVDRYMEMSLLSPEETKTLEQLQTTVEEWLVRSRVVGTKATTSGKMEITLADSNAQQITLPLLPASVTPRTGVQSSRGMNSGIQITGTTTGPRSYSDDPGRPRPDTEAVAAQDTLPAAPQSAVSKPGWGGV
jgi:hypothetical protein